MAVIVEWPLKVLNPASVAIYPKYMTRPDQRATNGMRRSPGVTGAEFRLALNDIFVGDEAKVRVLNSMIGHMEGNSTLIRFRLPDLYAIDGQFTPAGKARRALYPDGVPFASGVKFSGGKGFAPSYRGGALSEAAALGARTVYIADEEELPGGTLISIDDFTYTMRGVWMEDAGVNRVELSPTLRKAAAAGTEVEYAPVFVGVCTSDSPGGEARQNGRYGFFSFEFVEDITRLVDLT